MLKSFISFLGGVCVFFAVILFPSKLGIMFTDVINACWNVVVTVGKHISIPGMVSSHEIILKTFMHLL